jgi:hypothetical protein
MYGKHDYSLVEFFPSGLAGRRRAESKDSHSIITGTWESQESSTPRDGAQLNIPPVTCPLACRILRGSFSFDFAQLYFFEDGFVFEKVRFV